MIADSTTDDRSPHYDELLAAEEAAQKDEKGMWSPKPPAAKTYVDYSESLQKAKIQASVLQRQKKIPAVVDFVKSGSRFTVLIPRENAKLTFVLSGIRAPRSARNPTDKAEPFGQEAHDFATRRCMQRDVEIDVENTDKVGGFIGTLYVNRENFAKLLVEEGLASVHAYSAEQSGNATDLFAAEQRAKESHKGMWHDWDPSKDTADGSSEEPSEAAATTNGTSNGASDPAPRKKDYRDVVVTHIDPTTCRLKLQQVGTGTGALTQLMSTFRTFHLSPQNSKPLPSPPKAGDLVAARFSEDDEWYRAKVRRNDRDSQQAEVLYVDYGNCEMLPWTRLRALDAQFGTHALKPQAVDAVLSFLQFPSTPEYMADAAAFLGAVTADTPLVASVDAVAPASEAGALSVTLFDPKLSERLDESLNADVVGEGWAMVARKLKGWERGRDEVLERLRAREEEAKAGRRGVWEYGDLTED